MREGGRRMTYLIGQIPPLEAQISADVLVDGPCKFIIQLPGDKTENKGSDGHDDGKGNEQRLDLLPKLVDDPVLVVQDSDGVLDLVHLDGGVDQNADIVDDQADNLDSILHAEGIVDQDHLVYISKHEDGEIGGDGSGFIVIFGDIFDACLELAKYIAIDSVSREAVVGWMMSLRFQR